MNRKIISIIAVAVLVVALSVTLYILNNAPIPEQESSGAAAPPIYLIGSQEGYKRVKSMDIHNAKGDYTVYSDNVDAELKLNVEYKFAGLEDFPPGTLNMSALVEYAEFLTAVELVMENPEDLTHYGLDKPQATVDITFVDNSREKLIIGSHAPGGNQVYAMLGGSDTVYLIDSAVATRFLKDITEHYPLTVTGGVAEETMVYAVTLGGSVREEPISIRVNDGSYGSSVSTHLIVSPLEVGLNLGFGMEAINTLFAMEAEQVVDFAKNDAILEKYGLLEPYSTVSFTPDPDDASVEAFSLSTSKPDEGYVYILNNDTGVIFRMSAEGLKWIDVQLSGLMSTTIVLPYIDDLKSITIATPDASHAFDITVLGDEKALDISSGGTKINSEDFRKFYQTLLSARYDERATSSLTGRPNPLMTITYSYNNGDKPDVVYFYPGPIRKTYIALNDADSIYFMSTSYIDRVLSDIQKLLSGEAVRSLL